MKALVHAIGAGFERLSRYCLRRAYGIRIPASRIRLADAERDLEYIDKRCEEARDDVHYWSAQRVIAQSRVDEIRVEHETLVAASVKEVHV